TIPTSLTTQSLVADLDKTVASVNVLEKIKLMRKTLKIDNLKSYEVGGSGNLLATAFTRLTVPKIKSTINSAVASAKAASLDTAIKNRVDAMAKMPEGYEISDPLWLREKEELAQQGKLQQKLTEWKDVLTTG